MNLSNNKRLNSIFSALTCAFLLAMTATFAAAQSEQGRIAGQIADANGAVVPGATVTVKNVGTNEVRTTTANDEGFYVVPSLRAAVYTVSATGQNFAATNITDVQLSVGQQLDLPIVLTAQGQTVTVDVVGSSEAAIDTSSARIGATVNQREVQDLPLNGRQLSQLYLQAPGTVNSGTGTFGDIRFSGAANQQNIIRYDGVEGTGIIDASPGNLNGEVASPFRLQSSLENVQEFRADSNNFPAEFGTGTGGQISVVTKTGTNDFHGSLFEYFRNEKLDARNFFDNTTAGIPKSILRLNQFGGSLGGRLIKDKLFFFSSYEGYRVRAGVNSVEIVPYLSLGSAGSVIPTTTNPTGLPTVGATEVNANIRRYIAGFRSPGAVAVGYSGTPGLEIVQLQSTQITNEDAFFGRLDYNFNANNTFYVRYNRDSGKDSSPEGVSGRRTLITARPQNAVLGYTGIFNRRFVNEFRLGFNGATTTIDGVAGSPEYNGITINVSGTTANLPSNTIAGQGQSAGISVPGSLVRANSATNGRGQPYTPYSLSLIDSLNFTQGNHNVKVGGEIRLLRLKTDRLGGTTYVFQNFGSFLSGNLQSTQYLGDLSAVSPFTGASGRRTAEEEFYIAFAQDEWKIRPNLTLNYGLRYEYYTPLREKNNAQILFNIDNGTFRDPKERAFKSSKNNFGPRVALTYSPLPNGSGFFGGSKTVLRGGFGIYYGPGQIEDQIQPIESDRISSTLAGGTFSGSPTTDAAAIAASFINTPLNRQYQPRAYATNYTVPERVYQYSVSYQQELPYNLVSTVAYVGRKGTNLFLRSVANQVLPGSATILNGANLPAGVGVINRTNAAGQIIAVNTVRQFDILNGAGNPLRPFAEVDYKTSGGSDTYNALQTSLSRRFSTGLTMNAQYTFASSRGTSSGSNEARTSAQLDNFQADFGRNNFDVRHTFNVSALYALPFGKGKQFDIGGIGNYLLGGLEIGGIVNARSGLPIEIGIVRNDIVAVCGQVGGCTVGTTLVPQGFVANLGTNPTAGISLPTGFSATVNTPGGGASRNIRRPNIVAGQSFYLNNDRNIINPAAFTIPTPGTFGDLPRNALIGPIFRQFDLTINKRFRLTERANIQFRTEIFNLFNNTNFANPSAILSNALPNLSVPTNGTAYTLSSTNILQPGQAFTQAAAGGAFGQVRSTVGRTVGLGTNRQIQFALRLNF